MLKQILRKIWQKWIYAARIFGKVNSFVILTLFYFIIIGPISLARKFFNLFRSKEQPESYWVAKEESDKSNFKHQF
ncbi:MAG TPA: hypothetical protein QGH92_02565 [Candidatus Parcubacteria bacterium]|jgi:Zn-dependent protease|nr:hypothetical protein [Candidatus Parcubacteria bacterium]|tara:strand:+ start:288 stop:515 length:228 start_codon:yes stop_codon:yes gene_type:complete